ncbi:MAG: hypothetical protein LBT29_04745 [Flavobacteriaceae bacterium]|jgi:hypothetical protein|nr:hypothetical protein [Flavobacteriaceae bacterium]
MAKKTKKRSLSDILKGKFLIEGNAFSVWKAIVFFIALALISISSSHRVDEKVVKISQLKAEAEKYKAKYALIDSKLMKLKVESELGEMVLRDSLFALEKQPYKILVTRVLDDTIKKETNKK